MSTVNPTNVNNLCNLDEEANMLSRSETIEDVMQCEQLFQVAREWKEARKRQLREKFHKQCENLTLISEDGEIQGRWKRQRREFHLVNESCILPSPFNTALKEELQTVPRVVSDCSDTGTMSCELQDKNVPSSNCEFPLQGLNVNTQKHTSEHSNAKSEFVVEEDILDEFMDQYELVIHLPLAADLVHTFLSK